MKTQSRSPSTEIEVWLRILHRDGELRPAVAREILKLGFLKSDLKEMRELSAKARAGVLSREDDTTMDAYEQVGARLSILKSKARQVLKRGNHRG